jgi:hypothetical protein
MKTINIKTIRIDGGTQSRVEINNEIVTEYAEAIKAGADFPAVVAFNDGVDNWLADGFHRFHAHGQAGKASIAADVRQGTARDAVLYSLGANGTHGLNRTNADKRKAVTTMLNDAEWAKWSNGEIAKACSVTPQFVGHVRSSLETVSSEKPTERTYTTKHGTTATMQTASIGKAHPLVQPHRDAVKAAHEANIARGGNGVFGGASTETGIPVTAPVIAPEPEYTPLDAANDQIAGLQDQLAATIIGGASEDDKENAQTLLTDLRQRIKTLEATLKAVTLSRDTYMNENAELRKQITRQRKEIDKVTGKRTA